MLLDVICHFFKYLSLPTLIKLIVLSLFIFPVEQITFPDYAAVLSVKTYLHMCGLKFTTVLRTNAADMSPSGKNSIK